MRLRWTEAAAADLERIAEYLSVHQPSRAAGLVKSIYEAPRLPIDIRQIGSERPRRR